MIEILLCILVMILSAACFGIHLNNVNLHKELNELKNKPIDKSEILFAQKQIEGLNKETQRLQEERTQFVLDSQAQINKEMENWKNTEFLTLQTREKEAALISANQKLEDYIKEFEESTRKDAIKTSKAVNLGKITEHLIPFFPNFPFDSTECRFLGSPIDILAFVGLANDKVEKVVFCEIKTGKSALSKREKSLRDAIIRRDVEWIEIRNNYEEGGNA